MSLEMAHKVILPPKKNYIPQFLKQRDINSYYTLLYWLCTKTTVMEQGALSCHFLSSFPLITAWFSQLFRNFFPAESQSLISEDKIKY
jgi:hypothetical protein